MNHSRSIQKILVSGSSKAVGGYDDYVYLAELVREIELATKLSGEDIIRETIGAIREMLTSGWMVVGDLLESGFVPWTLGISEALERIEREWRALGREPNLGDVCWFENTPSGNEQVRQARRA